ncbi:MAG: hypothetical protein FWC22_02985 [Treponema sp.]|nr:hypothetical protein [Treponema sp.]
MKKLIKKLSLIIIVILITVNPAFSQANTDVKDLIDSMDTLASSLAQSLPFNATIGLNWSDAYIGKLLSVPPHFGIGVTAGATTLNAGSLQGVLELFDFDLPINLPIGFPLPGYTVDARIGGFILPFDIGIKAGYLDNDFTDLIGVNVDYLLIGADIRYAILNKKTSPVKLIVGLGYNYLRGGISTKIPDVAFEFDSGSGFTIDLKDSELGLEWHSTVIELKTQVSFKIPIVTPYAGVGVSYSWTTAGFNTKTTLSVTGGSNGLDDIKDELLEQLGIDASATGFKAFINNTDFNIRAYGGFSFNMAFIKLDFTFMYNIKDSALGATVGLRFQL